MTFGEDKRRDRLLLAKSLMAAIPHTDHPPCLTTPPRPRQPFGGGSFQRGSTLDLETGRFSAPEDGVYQLSAQIFLRRKPTKGPRRRTTPKPGKQRRHRTLRVSICIDSRCRPNS